MRYCEKCKDSEADYGSDLCEFCAEVADETETCAYWIDGIVSVYSKRCGVCYKCEQHSMERYGEVDNG